MTGLSRLDRQHLTDYHPFTRLRALLEGLPPGSSPCGSVINLSLGEPRTPPPRALIAPALHDTAADWSRYPLSKGTPDYLNACASWLEKRFDLPADLVHPDQNLIAVPGTREGLFLSALTVLPPPAQSRPVFLVPNPSYHVYIGAAAAADCDLYAVPATDDSGHLPDYTTVPEDILKRTKLCVLCSPSNPEGAVAPPAAIEQLITLARRYDFVVCFDECYSEIYVDSPPRSALETAARMHGDDRLKNILVFHSLSKRSGAAGLRCGFIAGDRDWIKKINTTLQVGGAGVPHPIQAAGAALWRDEAHVARNQQFYRKNFAVAQDSLSPHFDVTPPAGGFFLWLNVGDGITATQQLWTQVGLRVMPGAYMGLNDKNGVNPGAAFIRLALVEDSDLLKQALDALRDSLSRP